MAQQPKTDPRDVVFTAAQVGRLTTAYLQDRYEHRNDVGVPFGLPSIDAVMNPLMPGDLLVWLGRPGHGKTANLMRWARQRARYLQANGMTNRLVVYVTYEQTVEQLSAFHVASEIELSVTDMVRGNITPEYMDLIKDRSIKRAALPLWFIGHSLERRKTRPRLDAETLVEALHAIEEWQEADRRGYELDLVVVDYLQRIPFVGKVESKTIGMSDNMNRIKDAATHLGCPIVLGCQAKREVDQYNVPIPGMGDGQWTSDIEQVGDFVFSSVRPIKYKREGETFGSVTVQGRNQMVISLLKQKMGDCNIARWVDFDPAYNRLSEMEVEVTDLNVE